MKVTAFHEAGHALVALKTDGCDPIHKATIMPRGRALGMVMQLPDGDQTSMTRKQMLARLDVCMGGRVAEEIVYGTENVTSGASSDIMQATRLAKAMVTKYGLSDKVGIMFLDDKEKTSGDTQGVVDQEVRLLLTESYNRAKKLLETHRKELDAIATGLLEYESLSGAEIVDLTNGIKPDAKGLRSQRPSRSTQALPTSPSSSKANAIATSSGSSNGRGDAGSGHSGSSGSSSSGGTGGKDVGIAGTNSNTSASASIGTTNHSLFSFFGSSKTASTNSPTTTSSNSPTPNSSTSTSAPSTTSATTVSSSPTTAASVPSEAVKDAAKSAFTLFKAAAPSSPSPSTSTTTTMNSPTTSASPSISGNTTTSVISNPTTSDINTDDLTTTSTSTSSQNANINTSSNTSTSIHHHNPIPTLSLGNSLKRPTSPSSSSPATFDIPSPLTIGKKRNHVKETEVVMEGEEKEKNKEKNKEKDDVDEQSVGPQSPPKM